MSSGAGSRTPAAAGRQPVVIVAGPTASGKSALALAIAEAFAGTVINADSMQIYRELAVLTARPDAATMARCPHELYGVLPAGESCSAARWLEMAGAALDRAAAAGRLPVVCGGTGLYLRAMLDGLAPVPPIPPAIRAEAHALHERLGGPVFHARLAAADPAMAARLQPRDRQRLIRAWEVWRATGRSLADWQREAHAGAVPARFLTLLLLPARVCLYRACERRFAGMLAEGGLAEAAALAGLGLDPALPAMKALGVAPLLALLRGEIDRPAAVAAAVTATRRYAKRQATWFRHQIHADLVLESQYSERMNDKIFPKVRQFLLTATA